MSFKKQQPDFHRQFEDWSQLSATPLTSVILDNRSDDEKTAQARLINAEAKEKEDKNWWTRLSIGWIYFWRFFVVFLIGFGAGIFIGMAI